MKNLQNRRSFLKAVIALVTALVPGVAFGAMPQSKSSSSRSRGTRIPSYPPPVDTSKSRAAQKKLSDAHAQASSASSAMSRAVDSAKRSHLASPEFARAREAVRTARLELDALRSPLLASAQRDPEHAAAVAGKQQAEAEIEALRTKGATPAQLTVAAQACLEAGTEISRIEARFVAADARVAAAHAKLVTASAEVSAIEARFMKSISFDSSWQEARRRKDAADTANAAGHSELNAALQAERAAELRRQQQIAAINRQRQMASARSSRGSSRRRRRR